MILTIPLALVFSLEASVTTAMLRLTLALLNPPINRARTKTLKVLAQLHSAWDNVIPTYNRKTKHLLRKHHGCIPELN